MTTLRTATLEDVPTLAEIHIAASRAAYRGLVPDERLDRLHARRSQERVRSVLAGGDAETFAIEREGEPAGSVTLGRCRDGALDPDATGEIYGIYLSPDRWRQGLGTLACHEAERLLRKRGARIAVLWTFEANRAARRSYKAIGYVLDGGTRTIDVGVPLPIVRYRKRLTADEHPIDGLPTR